MLFRRMFHVYKVINNDVWQLLYTGHYSGNFTQRLHFTLTSQGASNTIKLSSSYTVATTITANYPTFVIEHASVALWGSKSSYVNYHQVWSGKSFNGAILVYGNSYNYIEFNPNAYYPNTKTWNIGTDDQDEHSNYCSGTEFYNKFYQLPPIADGYVSAGKIEVKKIGQPLTEYTVTRLVKDGNGISFYSDKGIIRVDKFTDGTSNGVYEYLAISADIEFKTVPDGIEVKSVLPWGAFVQDVQNVTIGTDEARFESGFFNYLDILASARLRDTLQVDGDTDIDGDADIGGDLSVTGAISGASLAVTGATTVRGWSNYRNTHKYQPPVSGNVYIDAMEVGETRSCTFGPLGNYIRR